MNDLSNTRDSRDFDRGLPMARYTFLISLLQQYLKRRVTVGTLRGELRRLHQEATDNFGALLDPFPEEDDEDDKDGFGNR